MIQQFFKNNRKMLYEKVAPGTLMVLFSGNAPRKTADENYPFFADRSFVYFTGLEQERLIFLAQVDEGSVRETVFLLPPNLMEERWTGRRIRREEAEDISGISEYEDTERFFKVFRKLVESGDYHALALDFDQIKPDEPPRDAYKLARYAGKQFPWLTCVNLHPTICRLRAIKRPCEVEAMRVAQDITRDGILAMMRASKPGMYEYQYKAEYDYALAQRGVISPAFPSIISAGKNNFCIHYTSYTGQAQDGDMILNDVGAIWDNACVDVSRGWPCNGKFTERQRLLYECAYATSNHMFEILKPGIPMDDVDRLVREYCYERLRDIGLCDTPEDVKRYMWHGGAHHVGFDVHDVVDYSGVTRPGNVFCVDVGIYNEDWGIGFRLEDNCLITEDGCENLSANTPRSIEEIEGYMRG